MKFLLVYRRYFFRLLLVSMILILISSKANSPENMFVSYKQNNLISVKPRINKYSNKLVFKGLKGTIYNPVPKQTKKNDCLLTASLTKIDTSLLKQGKIRYVALSRDLLKVHGGQIKYGDYILVESKHRVINGKWKVVDCMNRRWVNKIDFLFDEHQNLETTSFRGIKITVINR